jgi:RHS repeat-associated protein
VPIEAAQRNAIVCAVGSVKRRGPGGRFRTWAVALGLCLVGVVVLPATSNGDPLSPTPLIPPIAAPQQPAAASPAGSAAALQRQAAHVAWLRSPAAVSARLASSTAYMGLAASDSWALAKRSFPQLGQPLWAPPKLQPGDQVTGYAGDNVMRVDRAGPGGHVLVDSSLPLWAATTAGTTERLSVALADGGDAWVPENPITKTRIAKDPTRGIEFPQLGFSVHPAGATSGDAPQVVAGKVFFANTDADSDWSVAPLPNGVETYWQLRSPVSPESFTLAVAGPAGLSLQPAGDGSGAVEVMDGQMPVAVIASPVATDAQDQGVPVSYEIRGTSLIMHVSHRAGDFAYPILVDPTILDNDFTPQPSGWQFVSTSANYWGGFGDGPFGRGQYITRSSATAGPAGWGRWQYKSPGTTSYIDGFGFSNANADVGLNVCWVAGIMLSDLATWDGDADPLRISCGVSSFRGGGGWLNGSDTSKAAAMEFMNPSALSACCGAQGNSGYEEVSLGDDDAPTTPSVSMSPGPTPSGTWIDTSSISGTATSNDTGLGVSLMQAETDQDGGQVASQAIPRGCTGAAASPCQGPFTASVSQPLPEGTSNTWFSAEDAAGTWSYPPTTLTYNVDRTAPTLTFGGLLWDRRGRALTEDATLTVLARDGNPDPNRPSVHRSGMQSLTIEWKAGSDPNGTGTGYTAVTSGIGAPTGAAADGSSAKQEGSWTFPASTMAPGPYTVRVKGTDNLGHFTLQTFQFTVGMGSITTLKEGQATARRVSLQAKARAGLGQTGVTFQFRRSATAAWQDVPVGMVRQGRDQPVASWPVALNGDDSPKFSWDLAATPGVDFNDGDVQIQALFSGGASAGVSQDVKVSLDQTGIGGDSASSPIGPGQVNLLTGNFSTSATDVSIDSWGNDLTISRTYNSRQAATTGGPLGPGWQLGLPIEASGADYVGLFSYAEATAGLEDEDPMSCVMVETSDGSEITFSEGAVAADGLSTAWTPQDGYGDLKLKSVINPAISSTKVDHFELTQANGDVVTFKPTATLGLYQLASVQQAASQTPKTTYTFDGATGLVTRILAPTAAGVSCPSTLQPGCRALDLVYAQANATTWPGDYAGRLVSVTLNTATSSVEVAHYAYQSDGRLAQEWDPRLPALKTTYSYGTTGTAPNTATVLTAITPPGEQPWTMQYLAPATTGDKGTGRLSQVQRPSLDPTTGAVNGTATTSVVYSVPVQGAGAPYDLSAATSAGWDQVDMPTDATAIFPANQPVASPPLKANISYLNSEGRVVNSATPGGQIQTTERDKSGNVVRELSAVNRLTALATGTTVAAHAARSHELDTQRTYSADGVDLFDELGPAHTVAGITPEARKHTVIAYDEGKPTATVYHLPTTRTVGARALGATTDTDTRTTKTFYDWTLRQAIKIVVDPTVLAITTETKYDSATGLVTEQVMPRDAPSASTPKTAGTTQTFYYTAGSPTDNANCVNSLWANLPCKTKPAVDPAPAIAPKLPTTTYEYDESDHVVKQTDTVGTVARVTTTDYVNGRKAAENVTCPGCTAAEGAAVGQVSYGYSATTGRLLTTTNALDNRVITRAYDSLGRLTGYTDADATATTTKYDILDRPISVADGQGTRTFTYDDRGLTTQITDTDLGSPGAITGTYDADGNLTSQSLPGGLNVVTTFDATDTPARRCYIKATACSASAWMDFTAVQNIHGQQKSVQSAGVSSQNYTYDNAGRLTQTQDTVGGQCTVRTYGYDVDSNRVSLNTKPPGSGGACSTAAGTTITHTYDTADRLIDSAYTYDTFGRITHVPGRDAGAPLDTGYYVNDLARSITQGSKTTTIDLDPNRRPRSRTTTPPGAAELAHYADDTDEPSWTSKGGVTQRDIEGLDGDLAAVKTSGATATLQLVNLHGDVVGEAPASTTPTAPTVKFETDEFGVPRPGRGPIFQVGSTKAALTTAGTSITVAVPEGVQQSDLLLAMFALGNSADTTPTGWTAANANFTNSTTRYRLYYRIATATEPASYAFTISASGIHIASITALRNTATSAPAVTTAKNTSTDITAATITPASGDSAITVFAGQAVGDTNGGSVFDFPTPFTKTFEATSGTSLSAAAALRVLTGAAGVATGPITITSQTGAGSAAWGAITAAIAPTNPTPTQTRYGYLGSKQRYTSTGAGIIEMGARLYAPQLGRFLQTDPIMGGSCNDYDYACGDPVNQFDLDGRLMPGEGGIGGFGEPIGVLSGPVRVRLLPPPTTIGPKVARQLAPRGWTRQLVQSTIDRPMRITPTRDTRRLRGGGRMNDPATAYHSSRGGYVVRNDRTRDIVQVSHRLRTDWRAPFNR